jgi:hypothetical protein
MHARKGYSMHGLAELCSVCRQPSTEPSPAKRPSRSNARDTALVDPLVRKSEFLHPLAKHHLTCLPDGSRGHHIAMGRIAERRDTSDASRSANLLI